MLRIGFVTCVRLGLSCMKAIYAAGGSLQFAMTLRDDVAPTKSGRVVLDDFCAEHRIPLTKIANVNDQVAVEAITAAELDWLFIIGWSQIAKAAVLKSARKGVLGIHPTLLPIGRGRAPIPWAILLGLQETGVTLFQLDEGVDSGPILAQRRLAIGPRETATTLYDRIESAHFELLASIWRPLMEDRLTARPQVHETATYWRARTPADGLLTLASSVFDADRLIRAVTRPYPGAFLELERGRLRVWRAGAPFEDLGGAGRRGRTKRLHFADGWIDAIEWQVEE